MIICNKCGKDNQDHYKFCLGCGSELSSQMASDSSSSASPYSSSIGNANETPLSKPNMDPIDLEVPRTISPTPPAGVSPANYEPSPDLEETQPPPSITEEEHNVTPGHPHSTPVGAQPNSMPPGRINEPYNPAAAAVNNPEVTCPGCGTLNPAEFIFCGNCGTRVRDTVPPLSQKRAASEHSGVHEVRPKGKLALIRPDGIEGGFHYLTANETIIGRGTGPLFNHDTYLSPIHVRLTFQDGSLVVEDMGSLNGVFIKLTDDEILACGSMFRIGQELLRFDAIPEPHVLEDGTEIMGSPNPGYWGRLSVVMGPNTDGSAFPLMGDEMVLGREQGDILFSDDGYVSGMHAKISFREGNFFLADLGSSNGTFIRIFRPRIIQSGTFVLMGQQLFRVDF